MLGKRFGWVVGVTALALVGCGGGEKKAEEPVVEPADTLPENEPEEEVMIPAEKFDEIQAFFDRKRRTASHCFTEAVEAGEVKPTEKVALTVMLTIQPDGSPRDVRVTETNSGSDTLKNCLLDKVRSWTIVELPKPLDYSYTFAFERL